MKEPGAAEGVGEEEGEEEEEPQWVLAESALAAG